MRKPGFTLIELLVVVTIIVVLLAMLTPGMSKAIYQATLAQCAANLKAVAAGVQGYAFNSQRWYPPRGFMVNGQTPGPPTICLQCTRSDGANNGKFDMRPPLRDYVLLNKQLNDPFAPPVNLELQQDAPPYTIIMSSYAMWWGWVYSGPGGGDSMEKMGDRWVFNNTPYRLLASDYELLWLGRITASHPDAGGGKAGMYISSADNEPIPAWLGNGTISGWKRDDQVRGLLDMNNAYDDGSVARSPAVTLQDPRFDDVPYYQDCRNYWDRTFLQYIPHQ